jgi:hypothetical protein
MRYLLKINACSKPINKEQNLITIIKNIIQDLYEKWIFKNQYK